MSNPSQQLPPTRLPTPHLSVDLVRASKRSPSFPADWTNEKRAREFERYRKYLGLAMAYPREALTPTRAIDEFWHLHMQHPAAYLRDCLAMFGQIFDHDGGFGSSPEELPALQAAFARTAALWEETYGEPYVAAGEDPRVTNCWHDCQGRCWHDCKSDDDRSPGQNP